MKAKFIGVPGEELDGVTMYDIYFPRGKAVEVPVPSLAARKLANHPHFETKGDDVSDAKLKNELQTLTAAAVAPVVEQKVLADQAAGVKHGDNATAARNTNPAKARSGGSAGSTEFG